MQYVFFTAVTELFNNSEFNVSEV